MVKILYVKALSLLEIRNGHITEYRHDVIPKSAYHESLDASDDYDDSCQSESSRENVRYWSDFNRVFYTPRSIQKVADPAEWENIEGDWNHGKTVFSEYDEGLQVMNDTSSFGGFLNSFLTTFRDEHAKLPFLVIPILSRTPNATIDADDDSSCFARLDVSRGLTRAATSAFQDWSSRRALSDTLVSSIRTTPYPLPTSYPMFFKDARSSANSLRKGIFSGPESCAVFASLTTSSQTAYTFLSYASAIETYLKKKQDVNVLGFERDDLQDLTNELWTLHDNFGGEDEGS
ncbi:hypothetical protein H0H92_004326 [Tricholoma furcatifolium]|nr:hypothetical protein H0H92_004326 [Tricholoma furcatifolium]